LNDAAPVADPRAPRRAPTGAALRTAAVRLLAVPLALCVLGTAVLDFRVLIGGPRGVRLPSILHVVSPEFAWVWLVVLGPLLAYVLVCGIGRDTRLRTLLWALSALGLGLCLTFPAWVLLETILAQVSG